MSVPVSAQLPAKLGFFLQPARYKVAYGGRGSTKSWTAARALLILGAARPLRILCARETLTSIAESVHTLLADQIGELGLAGLYRVTDKSITGANGTSFAFCGLRELDAHSIKSYERVDIAWCEEAQAIRRRSWDILTPTIRAPGSEIWVTFNPDWELDETYQRFVVKPPAGAVVRKVSYRDNPWLTPELEKERLDMLSRDPIAYRNIWEGEPRAAVEGAIYRAELDAMKARIASVPVAPELPVHTAWDLGIGDATAIWFAQVAGREIRLVDYYEASGEGMPHYADVLSKRAYHYGKHYAPHDIQVRELGSGRTRLETAKEYGIRFEVAPNLPLEEGVHATRLMLGRCWVDATRCELGLRMLGRYRWGYNRALAEYKATPVHDAASHAADALRYLALALKEQRDAPMKRQQMYAQAGAWMG